MNRHLLAFIILFLSVHSVSFSQSNREMHLSLNEVINMAHERSLSALIAKHRFNASYWEFRSYKAEFLPSLNLNANLGGFNRSLTPLQNSQTGEINYIENYNMTNNVNLSIDQNIIPTGGKLSLYSSFERLDQFSPNRTATYYTQPVSLSYLQPIGGFNAFKWQKKTEPKKYEMAKRVYIESMEDVTINVVGYFFDLILEQQALDLAQKNYENTKSLYEIAKNRYEIGSVTKNELMQLELRMLNDDMSINNSKLDYDQKKFLLKSYIGITDDSDIVLSIPDFVPGIVMNYDELMALWERNSSFRLDQEIQLLNAQRDVAQAKGEQGVKIQLNARFGLTQTGDKVGAAYRNPFDQEVVGLQLTVPILDWGLSKGRVQMAKSRQEVVETQLLQDKIDKQQDIFIRIMQFNNQQKQCEISSRANSVANERYGITMEQFKNGTLSVTELNQSQTEKDQAVKTYINELRNYWYYYYNIRRISLFDYISNTDIVTQIDKVIEK